MSAEPEEYQVWQHQSPVYRPTNQRLSVEFEVPYGLTQDSLPDYLIDSIRDHFHPEDAADAELAPLKKLDAAVQEVCEAGSHNGV